MAGQSGADGDLRRLAVADCPRRSHPGPQLRSKVPILGDVPLVGAAFRRKEDTVRRTELIVFIRPRIVYDVEEARRITDEYRSELRIRSPEERPAGEIIWRDAAREFN
jgi:general secretion pathway protein D